MCALSLLENLSRVLLMTYPDDNPKTIYGLAKPGLTYVPPVGLLQVGRVMENGARKYGPMNWRGAAVTRSTYINAAMRHILADWDGSDTDPESGLPHLAHAAACLLILLDADAQDMLRDDRPITGTTQTFIAANTKDIAS